jgi:hypothetical protein
VVVTCAVHRLLRQRSCSDFLSKQGSSPPGHKTALRYPPAVAVPGRRGTGNAVRRRRPDGTAPRLAGDAGPRRPRRASNADSNADGRGWISMNAVGEWRVRHANALVASGRALPRSSSGSRSSRTAAGRSFLACHSRAIHTGLGRSLGVSHGQSRHSDLRSLLYRCATARMVRMVSSVAWNDSPCQANRYGPC